MSSFRRKLARLSPAKSGRRQGGADSGGAPSKRAFSLEDLDERIAALKRPPSREHARSVAEEHARALRLERVDHRAGKVWRRVQTLAPQSRCGATRLGAANQADPVLLSLLALTPALTHCKLTGAIYLDTETTGLGSGTGNLAFLVGLCRFDEANGCFVLEQYLLVDPDDEAAMLRAVCDRLGAAELVVTFNGKSFDLPLLEARCVMNRVKPVPRAPQLDLLHLVRRVHRHRSWRKTLVETEARVLGLHRGPDIAGPEVSERYRHFLRTADAKLLVEVLSHNAFDIISLIGLVGLYGEPVGRVAPQELAAMAMVLRRGGDLAGAAAFAEQAVRQGGEATALRARALVAKARGDRQQALSDFERLAQLVEDDEVRLELAKLYEHYLHAHDKALVVVEQGTGEGDERTAHRRARLERKLARDAEAHR